MTDQDRPQNPDDLLAAEYVLGVLPGPEWQQAHERAQVDGAFAARVADWEGRLSGLNEAYPEMPAPDVFGAIEDRLFPAPRRRARGWFGIRWGMALSGAVAAAAIAVLVVTTPWQPDSVQVALVGDTVAYNAGYDGALLSLTRTGAPAPSGQDFELWAIGADGVPESLGVLRGDTYLEAALPAGITLAISLEPEGGSPDRGPTGPVLATVVLAALD